MGNPPPKKKKKTKKKLSVLARRRRHPRVLGPIVHLALVHVPLPSAATPTPSPSSRASVPQAGAAPTATATTRTTTSTIPAIMTRGIALSRRWLLPGDMRWLGSPRGATGHAIVSGGRSERLALTFALALALPPPTCGSPPYRTPGPIIMIPSLATPTTTTTTITPTRPVPPVRV